MVLLSLSNIIGTCAKRKRLVLLVSFVWTNFYWSTYPYSREYLSLSNRPTLCIKAFFDRDPFMCRYAFCAPHGLFIPNVLQLCLQLQTSVPPLSFPRGRSTRSHPLEVFDRMFPFPGLSCPMPVLSDTSRDPSLANFLLLFAPVAPVRSSCTFLDFFELFLAWICICSQISTPVGFFLWLYFHKSKKKKWLETHTRR